MPQEIDTRSPMSVWSPISIHRSPKIAPGGKAILTPSPIRRNRCPAGLPAVMAPASRIAA